MRATGAAALALLACACGGEPSAPAGGAGENLAEVAAAGGNTATARSRERADGWVGVITARESADVAARIAGQVSQVHVRLGDRVEAGAAIAAVDDRALRDELAVARAALAAAEAAGAEAEVDVDGAREALRIERSARTSGNTSEQKVVEAEFRYKKMQATRDRARAAIGEHRARIRLLEQRLKQTAVAAPFSGTVSVRYVDPGAVLEAGAPIVRLITAGDLWVSFALPAEAARLLAPGDRVEAHIETLQITVAATVRQIAPELDPSSQMIFAEAELDIPDDLDGRIQSGLVARVRPAAE